MMIGIDNLSRAVDYNDEYNTKEGIIHLMYEVSTDEIILTKEGIDFIKKYWGFEEIAKILFEFEEGKGDFTDSFKTKEAITKWLENYKCIEW